MQGLHRSRVVCALSVIAACAAAAGADGEKAATRPSAKAKPQAARAKPLAATVYQADFAKGAGIEWSTRLTTETPTGRNRFLGRFARQAVSLRLADLPVHAYVRISLTCTSSAPGTVTTPTGDPTRGASTSPAGR